ncbi:triphosphoribosyl-dephospho-CoA synthase MdcB [Pseudoduganella sp. FT55W]|uniref:triphosphoribosyl-dephospho-CoA synthase n=1 Tax=Duganella rivi TaxID=2666083 RepID=A0A7X4KBZ0_9BURK|nr:triphosphoribosyl-dephospho-CoA synthase MdcB [Duganella rivi]MYM66848.1 triphosphoribosyl-dephospho-CoA synthase MdcB [Duganella rivi]
MTHIANARRALAQIGAGTTSARVAGVLGRAEQRAFAREIAQLAVRSLHAELCLYPKPGLVSPVDSGSHDDMDAGTFMRSMFALRHYFRKICLAGWNDAPFAQLKQLGIAAETAMLKATRGINTHRGAIFSLGMLCATAGRARAQGTPMTPAALRAALLIRWGEELAAHAAPITTPTVSEGASGDTVRASLRAPVGDAALSNGLRVAARYAVSGAREEGALGLPSVFEIGLPALLASRARGASVTEERIDTLYALMAHISDSNIYHRAGPQGAQIVRDHAERFLAQGGTANPNWYAEALHDHQVFIQHRLSPGGAADLLAACCLVQSIAALDSP